MTATRQCRHVSRRGIGSSEIISSPHRGSGQANDRSPLGSTSTAASSCMRAKRSISSSDSGATPCSAEAAAGASAAAAAATDDDDAAAAVVVTAAAAATAASAAAAPCDQRCTPYTTEWYMAASGK